MGNKLCGCNQGKEAEKNIEEIKEFNQRQYNNLNNNDFDYDDMRIGDNISRDMNMKNSLYSDETPITPLTNKKKNLDYYNNPTKDNDYDKINNINNFNMDDFNRRTKKRNSFNYNEDYYNSKKKNLFNNEFIFQKIGTTNNQLVNIFIINNLNKIKNAFKKYKEENYNTLNTGKITFSHKKYQKLIDTNQSIIFENILSSKSITLKSKNDKFTMKKFENGSIYFGEIINNQCTGIGKLITKKGEIIKGYFNNNYLQNYCIIKQENGIYFEGDIINNKIEGIGYEIISDNSFYYGEYKNNKKEGIGKYIWSNNYFYEGEFKNNKMNGYGIINYNDGRYYEGEFKNNKMNGLGLFKWNDGRKYFGIFENDIRNSFGIFLWKEPLKIYVGFWKNGKQNGLGKLKTSYKEIYCFWKDSKKNKQFNSKEKFIENINKCNDKNVKQYFYFFQLNFDDIMSIMLEI